MIEKFIKEFEYYEDISLKKYNTYKIDAKCKYLVFPKNIEELKKILKYIKENKYKYLILGNGSNIIFAFEYFNGIIIKLDRFNQLKINKNIITVSAGYSLMKLAREVANKELSGLEFAGGIPGLVGASVAMNAGAYKRDMASIVKEVKVLTSDLKVITLTNQDLEFNYRSSYFKSHKEYICLEAVLELEKKNKEEIFSLMEDRQKRRLESQPLDLPSAGSVFRNPEGMYAGELIEKLGLKGKRINDAGISEKHANFIVNVGNAKGEDIVKLIDLIKIKVKEKYQVDLILEQEIIR